MGYFFNFGVPGFMEVLTEEQRGVINGLGVLRRYSHRQHMQSRGDAEQAFSIIREGAVCFGKNDSDGRFIALAVLEVGQCYGEFTVFAGLPRTHDGYAQGETVVSHISKPVFDRLLLDRPDFAAPIIRLQTLRLHSALEWADDLRRYPLRFRLGKQLMIMVSAEAEGRLEVTQAELADLLGVSRVAISGALQEYQKRGFIRLVYGGVEIVDSAGFKTWLAEFVRLDPISLNTTAAEVRTMVSG